MSLSLCVCVSQRLISSLLDVLDPPHRRKTLMEPIIMLWQEKCPRYFFPKDGKRMFWKVSLM